MLTLKNKSCQRSREKGAIRLDARKKNVLLAVVEAYIQTGEPVGSKMISQLPQIHVSAATVRNDMAVLEELGYHQNAS